MAATHSHEGQEAEARPLPLCPPPRAEALVPGRSLQNTATCGQWLEEHTTDTAWAWTVGFCHPLRPPVCTLELHSPPHDHLDGVWGPLLTSRNPEPQLWCSSPQIIPIRAEKARVFRRQREK